MKPHTEAYVATVLCAGATLAFIIRGFQWWQCAIAILVTLFCAVTALDLHAQYCDRQRLRGQS